MCIEAIARHLEELAGLVIGLCSMPIAFVDRAVMSAESWASAFNAIVPAHSPKIIDDTLSRDIQFRVGLTEIAALPTNS